MARQRKSRSAPRAVDRLVAAVHADPDNDSLRAVLGDALLDRGDPRGELIQLQLAGRDDDDRVSALLAAHRREWLDGLDELEVLGTRVAFRRGFIAGVDLVKPPTNKQLELPAWRTVEQITAAQLDARDLARVLAHPNLERVRRIDAPLRALRRVDRGFELVRAAPTSRAREPALANLPRSLRARELAIYSDGAVVPPVHDLLHWLDHQPQLDSLEVFTIDHATVGLWDAVVWLRAEPRPLRVVFAMLIAAPDLWHLELVRAGPGAVAITGIFMHSSRGDAPSQGGLGGMLARLPLGSLASFTARTTPVSDATREAVERELADGLRVHGLAAPNLAANAR